jgi:hypothetical protein
MMGFFCRRRVIQLAAIFGTAFGIFSATSRRNPRRAKPINFSSFPSIIYILACIRIQEFSEKTLKHTKK